MKYIKRTLAMTMLSSVIFSAYAQADSLRMGHIKDTSSIIVTSMNAMTKKVAGDYVNYTLYVNDKVMINQKPYYRVQVTPDINNAIGYVAAEDLTIRPVKDTAKPDTTLVLSASTKVYSVPEGTERQIIDRAPKNESVTVNQSLQVGGKVYHEITRPTGLTGWIKANSHTKAQKPQVRQAVNKVKKIVKPAQSVIKKPVVKTEIKATPIAGARMVATSLEDAYKAQMRLTPRPQTSNGIKWYNAPKSAILAAMDTGKLAADSVNRYQFLNLTEPQGLSVAQLNYLLQGKGILEGRGQAFKTASERYGINEIYLISHAFLETGEGTSELAQGKKVKGADKKKKYYNMFGIGAFDKHAVKYGAQYAANVGWDTPDKAIIGGAKFISTGYLSESQNTLYKMRWNPDAPGQTQYATDIHWAHANARYLVQFYQQLGLEGTHFDFVQYSK
ncbi:N-acetylglucosaminidase [Macrococcus brunensis]|uniref:N-acetylglucosaminidase n=1 Tax=Macrococcus brunensis TaxID=198483 RepID=UPI001EEFABBA|nr:N-acetylglucosaminidase [Macrococcus brunensis]ULG72447.1 N-acetylglucosaminidase [Macrococcus brunensis]ULG74702.1 N-acetylglucosaminidase [Macrococcus brunensis]